MLRSCAVCGGIHEEDKMCKRTYKKDSKAYYFRNSNKWILKREQIKKRDYKPQVFRNIWFKKQNWNKQYTNK